MQGEITKIDEPKQSRNSGQVFIRVYFKMFPSGDWATTDIVRGFRNYSRWRDKLRKGNTLTGLQMLGSDKVDADSYPELREHPEMSLEAEEAMKLCKNCL